MLKEKTSKFGYFQENKGIGYASRALRDAETRYAQIKKILLEVMFGLLHFKTGVDMI